MIVYEVDISGICLVYPSTWYITGIYQTYVVHTILYGFQMLGPAVSESDGHGLSHRGTRPPPGRATERVRRAL